MLHPKLEYKGLGSGWCLVPYCKEGAKWFTCANCGKVACGYHQLFDVSDKMGPVFACYYCRPDLWDIKTGRIKEDSMKKYLENKYKTKTQEGSTK